MYTVSKAIDAMTPIGRASASSSSATARSGKQPSAVDTIIRQKDTRREVHLCRHGQKKSTVAQVVEALPQERRMDYTVVVSACASDPATLQYVAAYAGCSIGEYWRDRETGRFIIYDDLSKQAVAYRRFPALRRPPGREAFPGDIFL